MSPATRRDFNPDLTLTFVYHYSPLVALAAGLGFGIYFALVDTIIFRSAWPDGQKALLTEPASTRMLLFGFRALNDELVLRLVAMTTIAAVLVAIAGKRSTWCYWGAIFAVALVVAPLWESTFLASLDWTPLVVVRTIAIYATATTLWGWLYWRHGFLAGVTGHVSAHLALQPALSVLA